jgi:hypothetical protein
MERRPHPGYFRRVAGYSVGLFGVSMGCLVAGFVLVRVGLPQVGDVLYFAFAGSAIVLLIMWFAGGETTTCPECGRRLRADPHHDPHENLVFICRDCDIEWDTGRLLDS